MDDLLSEFLTETNESLDVINAELVVFEKDTNNKGVLDNIFRLVHTIKGTCGFLGLPRLEAVAHASENVLGKFRDGALQVSSDSVSLILQSIDTIKGLLADLEANECEPEGNDQQLIADLNLVASGGQPSGAKTEPAKVAAAEIAPPPAPKPAVEKPVSNDQDAAAINPVVQTGIRPGEVSMEELEAAFNAAPGPDDEPAPVEEVVAAQVEGPVKAAPVAAKSEKPANAEQSKSPESSLANQSVRVSVELLEDLMTVVSELVLTRNQLMQIVRKSDDSDFKVPLQRLNQVTTELQEGVMKTRMQPIGSAWQKLPRIVRDLCNDLNKKIELVMIGAETELDRQVMEMIKDPLTHMIRNSADHGLERPDVRTAAGKQAAGTIKLNAFHEGGHVIIEISDDGAGLNIERIKAKAISRGLVTEAEADELSEQQIANFIFKAGLSTAEKVTSVSGRGVGMDVVRSNIEKIGGTVDVRTTVGKGSVFTVKIPLTLAIVSALVVEVCGERFAIPQISVNELVRASNNSGHRIELIKDSPILRLREQLLPLVYLSDVLRMQGKKLDRAVETGDVDQHNDEFVVVTQVGSFRFGIVVDKVFDTEEIVVKPVAPILRDISVFSGNTILGDGSVIMILDPNGVADSCGNTRNEQDETLAGSAAATEQSDKISILVFRAGGAEPKAIPLSLVSRLEEVNCADIEHADGRDMVQYRGQLMPLVRISDDCKLRTEGRQPLLVFSDAQRTMGIAVDEIVDIVEDILKIELSSDKPNMLGTAIINGAATEIADVGYYLVKAFPDWFEESRKSRDKKVQRALLVDDSAFFRNMLAPLISSAGYKVTTVENASQALALRDKGAVFDVIISDIEMPGMNGFELAQDIRKDDRWSEVPIVAISSNGAKEDFERGRAVGFTDYVVKMDRDSLLRSLSEIVYSNGKAA